MNEVQNWAKTCIYRMKMYSFTGVEEEEEEIYSWKQLLKITLLSWYVAQTKS